MFIGKHQSMLRTGGSIRATMFPTQNCRRGVVLLEHQRVFIIWMSY